MQRAFIVGSLLACIGLVGCFDERRPAQSADEYEYDDQAEYGSTPTHGPGSEEQGGYYGVGSAEPPSHQPATPSGGGHQPY